MTGDQPVTTVQPIAKSPGFQEHPLSLTVHTPTGTSTDSEGGVPHPDFLPSCLASIFPEVCFSVLA